jgi:hypothetical protein
LSEAGTGSREKSPGEVLESDPAHEGDGNNGHKHDNAEPQQRRAVIWLGLGSPDIRTRYVPVPQVAIFRKMVIHAETPKHVAQSLVATAHRIFTVPSYPLNLSTAS